MCVSLIGTSKMHQIKAAIKIVRKVRAMLRDVVESRTNVKLIFVRIINVDECD
jgi:hypothetical protein